MPPYALIKDIFLICFTLLSAAFLLGRMIQKTNYRIEVALNIFHSINGNLTKINEKLEKAVYCAKSRHAEHTERIA